ncbi:MAG: class I SAM-dependent methyltransferase [Ignavibacteriaceae bacterium]
MLLNDAIDLIRNDALSKTCAQTWADLGCGSGTFTKALANLLPDNSIIYAVDKNRSDLINVGRNEKIKVEKIDADFINDDLPLNLDGILMANSLHYVEEKSPFIKKIEKNFKSDSLFLIVEYDMDISNHWVPFPLSYNSLKLLFENEGYNSIKKLKERASLYRRTNIYSALINKNILL